MEVALAAPRINRFLHSPALWSTLMNRIILVACGFVLLLSVPTKSYAQYLGKSCRSSIVQVQPYLSPYHYLSNRYSSSHYHVPLNHRDLGARTLKNRYHGNRITKSGHSFYRLGRNYYGNSPNNQFYWGGSGIQLRFGF